MIAILFFSLFCATYFVGEYLWATLQCPLTSLYATSSSNLFWQGPSSITHLTNLPQENSILVQVDESVAKLTILPWWPLRWCLAMLNEQLEEKDTVEFSSATKPEGTLPSGFFINCHHISHSLSHAKPSMDSSSSYYFCFSPRGLSFGTAGTFSLDMDLQTETILGRNWMKELDSKESVKDE